MLVFGKAIKTEQFEAVAGMPVPAKYATRDCVRFFRQKYGEDVVKEIDFSSTEDFAALVSGDTGAAEAVKSLKVACEEQAGTIRQLRRENGQLKAALGRKSSQ